MVGHANPGCHTAGKARDSEGDLVFVRLAFRAELRRRWRSWLAIVALVGLVGGVVLGAVEAGRRTQSAFPAFVAAHGFDSYIYSTSPVPSMAKLPMVKSAELTFGPDNGPATCRCRAPIPESNIGLLVPTSAHAPLPFKLVSGRLPDPGSQNQVVVSYTLKKDYGVQLGTVIRMPLYSSSQTAAYNNAEGTLPKPLGPNLAYRVVGFEVTEFEFPAGGPPSYDLFTSAAFARTVLPRAAHGYVYFVRLRHGAADIPRFDVAMQKLTGFAYNQNADEQVASVEASIHPQAIGWWVLAALAALVGLAVVGQALARQTIAESSDYPTFGALGANRTQLLTLGLARNVMLAAIGAVSAVVIAVLLSPVAPLGEARMAEPSTGFRFYGPVLALGAVGVAVIVLVLGLWPALQAARAFPRQPLGSAEVSHLHPGQSCGRARCTAERRGRGAQRARAQEWPRHHSGLERGPGRGPRRARALRDGRLRRQLVPSHHHAPALRRSVPAQLQ